MAGLGRPGTWFRYAARCASSYPSRRPRPSASSGHRSISEMGWARLSGLGTRFRYAALVPRDATQPAKWDTRQVVRVRSPGFDTRLAARAATLRDGRRRPPQGTAQPAKWGVPGRASSVTRLRRRAATLRDGVVPRPPQGTAQPAGNAVGSGWMSIDLGRHASHTVFRP
jgi:hypothetical protein